MTDVPLEDTLRRLKQVRDQADRRYNDALTALDRSVRPPVDIPQPELALDDQKIAALNEAWNILPSPPAMPGVKGRLAGFIWRTVAPYLQRQLTFNALVVEHENRNADARRAAHRRDGETLAAIRGQMHQLTAFQGRLMVLLQQITAYVDTKDRDAAGGLLVLNAAFSTLADAHGKHRESLKAREHRYEARTAAVAAAHEELRGALGLNQQAIVAFNAALSSVSDSYGKYRESLEAREHRYEARTAAVAAAQEELRGILGLKQQQSIVAFNAALSGLADSYGKYRESLEAREHRYEARTTAIAAAHEELRGILGLNQQAIVALKRAIKGPKVSRSVSPQVPGSVGPTDVFAPSLDAYKYVAFEDQFRGSREVIRERLESYIPYFQTCLAEGSAKADVLDVGCGRGEFLDLLAAHGIPARGIDLNHEMAEVCRARGLNVVEADAVQYLTALPDDSLGGIFAAQVVEHLEPAYLLLFLDAAFEKLQPGGRLVVETLNPACWTAFFESYIRDITHRCPLHPETLKYLVLASGFSRADIDFRSPMPPEDRLQPIAVALGADDAERELAETFNANVDKLNARMFTHMDYAIIAEKVAPR